MVIDQVPNSRSKPATVDCLDSSGLILKQDFPSRKSSKQTVQREYDNIPITFVITSVSSSTSIKIGAKATHRRFDHSANELHQI